MKARNSRESKGATSYKRNRRTNVTRDANHEETLVPESKLSDGMPSVSAITEPIPPTPNAVPNHASIFDSLVERGLLKKNIIDSTADVFKSIRDLLSEFNDELVNYLKQKNIELDVAFTDRGASETELRLNDDILIFSLHSNVFRFDHEHLMWQSPYIEQDPNRADCGMILIYNFLSDSFKYNRNYDTGYLIGRIFVNKDKHLFVEGKRQLGFLYTDIETGLATDKLLRDIIESAIVYAMNFEIHVPSFDMMKEMTVQQKIDQSGTLPKLAKRLGFRFSGERDDVPPPAY